MEASVETPSWLSVEKWSGFLTGAYTGGVEFSLEELIESLGNGECSLLEGLSWLTRALPLARIESTPLLNEGDALQNRLFVSNAASTVDAANEISTGESHYLEFKSSFCFDRKRAAKDPSATLQDLNSAGVFRDFLKSIAGFMNTKGGVLWVGVDDDGNAAGIVDDCRVWQADPDDHDSLEIRIRNYLKSNFYGPDVGYYVDIQFLEHQSVIAVRFDVRKRKELTFVKNGESGRYELFRRQGNSTVELEIYQVEEFLLERGSRG